LEKSLSERSICFSSGIINLTNIMLFFILNYSNSSMPRRLVIFSNILVWSVQRWFRFSNQSLHKHAFIRSVWYSLFTFESDKICLIVSLVESYSLPKSKQSVKKTGTSILRITGFKKFSYNTSSIFCRFYSIVIPYTLLISFYSGLFDQWVTIMQILGHTCPPNISSNFRIQSIVLFWENFVVPLTMIGTRLIVEVDF